MCSNTWEHRSVDMLKSESLDSLSNTYVCPNTCVLESPIQAVMESMTPTSTASSFLLLPKVGMFLMLAWNSQWE